VCARVCVRVCVRLCVRVRVCVFYNKYYETNTLSQSQRQKPERAAYKTLLKNSFIELSAINAS
jgi:hypothetical protein